MEQSLKRLEEQEQKYSAELDAALNEYAGLREQAQGFDLEPYAGQICTQYVYKVENHPGDDQVYATLLVYGDEIIGGDIASTAVDGFMHGFAADSARFNMPQGEN